MRVIGYARIDYQWFPLMRPAGCSGSGEGADVNRPLATGAVRGVPPCVMSWSRASGARNSAGGCACWWGLCVRACVLGVLGCDPRPGPGHITACHCRQRIHVPSIFRTVLRGGGRGPFAGLEGPVRWLDRGAIDVPSIFFTFLTYVDVDCGRANSHSAASPPNAANADRTMWCCSGLPQPS